MQSILDHVYLTPEICQHCASLEGFAEAEKFAEIFDNYPDVIGTFSAWGRLGSPLQNTLPATQFEGFDLGRNEGQRELVLKFLAMAKVGKMARSEFVEFARAEHDIDI